MSEINWDKLAEPFPSIDIEWRAGKCGVRNGKAWALVLAYVTNRAIMERLDAVAGPANWRNEYREGPDGGVLCGISIRVGDEWITKWDGAPNTQIESVKGGLSGAMKRAAVQWGIGRYLYKLEENFAEIVERRGPNVHTSQTKDKKHTILWRPPRLPEWALPKGCSDTGAARSINLEDDSPPAEVVDAAPAKSPEPKQESKPETLEATPEMQNNWIEQIEGIPSYDQLVKLEKVITAESTVMEDGSRYSLFRLICMKAKSLLKSDKAAQQKMLERVKIYSNRYSWLPSGDADSLIEILRSHWS